MGIVLEDEFFIGAALAEILADAGADVISIARTVAQAREATEEKFDFAILDIRVACGTSYEFAKELLGQGIAVVFYSGHADVEERVDFPSAVFCQKPATPAQLIGSVLEARLKLKPNDEARAY